jgi:SAM-dependent methyltransferase
MFVNHTYLSGTTTSLREHFGRVAVSVDEQYFRNRADDEQLKVLDIGSNDGTFLDQFKRLGWKVVGVESSKVAAKLANDAGIKTYNLFYNEEAQRVIGEKFHVVHASGVFFHLEELHSVTRAVKAALMEDGVFVVQFLYMKSIMENGAFDQIYHEHLLYYTLETLNVLLKRHDLEIFDAVSDPIHGGSMIAHVGHIGSRPLTSRFQRAVLEEKVSGCNELRAYQKLQIDAITFKESNLGFLERCAQQGLKVYGLGAPVKGNTLLNFLGIDHKRIQCLVERNPLRKGLVAPGSHIPVLLEEELTDIPDVYYVLAWNFKKEIIERYKDLIEKGVQFYFPINPR